MYLLLFMACPELFQGKMQIELERIGLADKIHEKVRTLSGGQLRRVECKIR